MFSFFKNKNINHNNDEDIFSKVASLLIHIAKIDQNYTTKEKEITHPQLQHLLMKQMDIQQKLMVPGILKRKLKVLKPQSVYSQQWELHLLLMHRMDLMNLVVEI